MALSKARALHEAERSVAQGKISQAIRQYLEIFENDPSDVSLLNTVGDLYIRDRNVGEGLRQFHRLAEEYVREGFNVKAIAMYKKISKVDPSSVETLLKLAELYQLQGLSREAREQYLQAAQVYRKRNQADRTLDVLRKLVQLDPENSTFRSRLAEEFERTGRAEEAAQAYLESAEALLLHDDVGAAETALRKAAELAPKNPQVQLLRVRVAMSQQQPEEAEKIIQASPDLLSNAIWPRRSSPRRKSW
jgi:Flp pilus assembly protein TadD